MALVGGLCVGTSVGGRWKLGITIVDLGFAGAFE
jgi:hypothetical protein